MAISLGTSASDSIDGTSGDDLIAGLTGADALRGLSGNDIIAGNAIPPGAESEDAEARDTLFGGEGDDQLLGQAGGDRLGGGSGSDTLFGGTGRDRLNGASGADILEGGFNNDTFIVDTVTDQVREAAGGGGSDVVRSNASDFTFSDTPGEDHLERLNINQDAGAAGATGNSRDNTLVGNSADNSLAGLDGDDILNGGSGIDSLIGGLGNDTFVIGNAGDQAIELADEGQDFLRAAVNFTLGANIEDGRAEIGAGDVDLSGNTLDNSLEGNSGTNSLAGGSGADRIDGGLGADTLDGGSGDDVFLIDDAGDQIVEASDGGNDRAVIDADGYTLAANVEVGALARGDNNHSLTSGEGDQTLRGNTGDNLLFGQSGDDLLTGNAGKDTLYGGDDNDRLQGQVGSDVAFGGDGDDQLGGAVDGVGDSLFGGSGSDIIFMRPDDVGYGGDGDDTFSSSSVGLSGGETIDGGDGSDSLLLSEGENLNHAVVLQDVESVVFVGTSAQESFDGSETADTMTVGSGADTLVGGEGDDRLDGGSGFDTAVFAGSLSDFQVLLGANDVTVIDGSGDNGTDLLSDVEALAFDDGTLDLNANVRLLDGNALLGTFATIQAAVDVAGTSNTIEIAAGTYNESVTVDKALSFIGQGEVVVTPGSGSAFIVDGDLGSGNTLSFDGIDMIGAPESAIVFGPGDALGTLEVRNAQIEANTRNGIEIVNGAGLGNVIIEDSDFVGNGEPSGSSGDGDILLFNYTGDATLRNLTLEGQDRGNGEAETGIQFRSDSGSMGVVLIENVEISGIYEKQAIGIFNYDDVSGLSITDLTITADSTSFQTSLNFDGIGSGIDLSDGSRFQNLDISNSDIISLQGDGNANTITGATEGEFLRGRDGNDLLSGGSGDDTLVGDSLGSGSGDDTLVGGSGNDALFGEESADTLDGGDGDDVGEGGLGQDSLSGGDGNDTLIGEGAIADSIVIPVSASFTTDFSEFDLGPITDGQNDWVVKSTNRDQEIVDLGGSFGQVFRMSSDPNQADFAGPFSPPAPLAAGEPQTTADVDSLRISFDFRAVSDNPDSSRLEVDFGNDAATDRNNFMVIEWEDSVGLRIAVNDPTTTPFVWNPNDFAAFTGNRTLIDGLDSGGAQWHRIDMILRFEDGPDNDVIDIFLDGNLIGTTTTFENFRDWSNPDHAATAEANITSRLFFRPSAGGAPNDGPGGENEGFYFDNVSVTGFQSGIAHADVLEGGAGDDDLSGQLGDDSLFGGSGMDSLTGGTGDDSLEGGLGDDSLDGGSGFDQAVFAGDFADATLATSGGDFLVTTTDGTDAVTAVEQLAFDDQTVLVVGAGGFASIQAAVDAASSGDTIAVLEGTYAESVTLDKAVSLVGVGEVVVTPTSGSAFIVDGDLGSGNTLSFDGIDMIGASESGIVFGPGDTLGTLEVRNARIESNDRNGIEIVNGAGLGNAIIEDSDFVANGEPSSSSGDGDILFFNYTDDATLRNLTLEGQDRGNGEAENGIQFRSDTGSMGTVLIENVEISGIYEKQAIGIFNYDDVSGLSITDLTITADSTSFQTSLNFDGIGSGIDLSDGSRFQNLDISASDIISLQGDGNANTIIGATEGEFLRGRNGDDLLIGGTGADTLVGDSLGSGSGNDTLVGGSGDDVLFGEEGLDAAVFSGNLADATIAVSGSGDAIITTAEGGSDTLNSVEELRFDDVDVLMVGGNGFATIQAAVDAATAGDTILVLEGSYTETVIVDKQVTIQGAQAGVDGSDPGRGSGESSVVGAIWIQANGVTLDGLRIEDGATVSGSKAGVYVTGDDATLTNMLLERGGSFDGFRGVLTPTNSDESGLTITASKFSGWATGVYTDSDSDFEVTGNSFEANNVGLSADFPTLPEDVDNNDFTSNLFEDFGLGISDSSFDLGALVGDANSFSGGVPEVSAYALAPGTAQTIEGSDANDQMQVISASSVEFNGLTGNDVLLGGDENDILRGGEGDDEISGGDGNDLLFAGSGNDTLTGGTGADSFRFTSNEGSSEVTDFNVGEVGEVIGIEVSINGTDITDFADLAGRLSVTGGDVVIDLSNRPEDAGADVDFKVTLDGVSDTALLASDDFVFFF
ncbi:MAG: hypothetical protein AAFY02_00325 [Pseudomonadota bacterium]